MSVNHRLTKIILSAKLYTYRLQFIYFITKCKFQFTLIYLHMAKAKLGPGIVMNNTLSHNQKKE